MPDAPYLAPHHLAMLEASAIAPDVIAARGYFTATTPEELAALGFGQTQCLPGLVIPIYNVWGKLGTYVLRPDHPRVTNEKGKTAKYEFMRGARMVLDVPNFDTLREALRDPLVPLWITEGAKKVDSLASRGCCAVAVLGVWSWRGTNKYGGKTLLADWDVTALNGRMVSIVYDSDVMTKREVRAALKRLAALLKARQAHVRYVYLPDGPDGEKQGIDDFFAQGHTVEDAIALSSPTLKEQVVTDKTRTQAGTQPAQQAFTFPHTTAHGQPKAVLANVVAALMQDARWQGVFGHDEFRDATMLRKRPPYVMDTPATWTVQPITNSDDAEATNWMQNTYGLFASTGVVNEAISMVARRYPYHPIREYLDALEWDRKPRLDTWLIRYCNAADTSYTRAVGSKTLMGAVARAMRPGVKMDTVTVLETLKQGTRKSTTWSTLSGEEWFSDHLPPLHQKDAAQELRGKWIIELGELAVLHSSEVEQIKRFISASQDHYRPSYGRRAETFLRQNIFVGSTNRETYLKDETGNRRFWPVLLAGDCDVDGLMRDRDQLWAEAVSRYLAGNIWHLTREEEELATIEQEGRLEDDPWEEAVSAYLRRYSQVTTGEVFASCLGMHLADITMGHSKRLGALLRRLQWTATTRRVSEANGATKPTRVWRPIGKESHAVTSAVTSVSVTVTPVMALSIGDPAKKEEEEEKKNNLYGLYTKTAVSPLQPFQASAPCLHTWLKVEGIEKCVHCNGVRRN